jgi:hypothetical protein
MLVTIKGMRMNRLLMKIIVSVLLLFVVGGKGMAVPIPSEVKPVATYIFIDNGGKLIPNGAGFFVGLKNPAKRDSFGLYLVTAKHVLCPPGSKQMLDKIYIRLNKKSGGSEMDAIPLSVKGNKRTVFFHSDPTVNLAVLPVLPDQKKIDFKFIPDESILTKEESTNRALYEGAEVFYPSLFFPYTGVGELYPCVRFGRVALLADKKIEWQGYSAEIFLVETGSNGGNNGTPVFFYSASNRASEGQPAIKLAGIMEGTFGDAPQEIKIVEKRKVAIPFSNVGMAAVIPAYKLYEVLFSEELKKERGF